MRILPVYLWALLCVGLPGQNAKAKVDCEGVRQSTGRRPDAIIFLPKSQTEMNGGAYPFGFALLKLHLVFHRSQLPTGASYYL